MASSLQLYVALMTSLLRAASTLSPAIIDRCA
jgi:hypothetical protein